MQSDSGGQPEWRAQLSLEFCALFYERNCVDVTVRTVCSQSKFYLAELRFENAGADLSESLINGTNRLFCTRGIEKKRGDQRFFVGIFEEVVEVVASGPGVVFEFAEETVEQRAGQMRRIDPVVRKHCAEGFAELLEVQAHEQQVVFGGVGGVGCGGRIFRKGLG